MTISINDDIRIQRWPDGLWLVTVYQRGDYGIEFIQQLLNRDEMRLLADEIYSELDLTCDECGELGEVTTVCTGAEVCSHCMDGHTEWMRGGC
jgi:hypothetical protein